MIRRLAILALLVLIGSAPGMAASAQAPDAQLIDGTVPLGTDTRISLAGYLATYPPSPARFYAPTYSQDEGTRTLVSVVGLAIDAADQPWVIEGHDDGAQSNVIWAGTLAVYPDGNVEIHSSSQARQLTIPHLAAPVLPAPGGGSGIYFPWISGKSMMYGPRLIHGSGDYGTSGMYAVDFVGGTDLGSNVAPDRVTASQVGTVDYVCTDDTQKVIRTYNAATDDYFLYAHLVDNSSLVLDHVFSRGSTIASLVHGTFDDDCGWAEQSNNHYHVHWMFKPANSAFSVGGCTLRFSDKKFHCGDKTIGAGGWLVSAAPSGGVDDPGSVATPSIWDNIIAGITQLVTSVISKFPTHNASTPIIRGVLNTIILMFRLVWLLLRPNLNLQTMATIILFLIAEQIIFGIIWVIFWVIRVLRQLKQLLSPLG